MLVAADKPPQPSAHTPWNDSTTSLAPSPPTGRVENARLR